MIRTEIVRPGESLRAPFAQFRYEADPWTRIAATLGVAIAFITVERNFRKGEGMIGSEQLLKNFLRTGAVATIATTAAVAACGRREQRGLFAPLNAVSHIAWGNKAARRRGPSWKYTFTGLLLNAAAVTSWAALHELLAACSPGRRSIAKAILGGPAVSGIAYATDYHLVPARLTPGFEKQLSTRSLLGIYSILAVALTVGGLGNLLSHRPQ